MKQFEIGELIKQSEPRCLVQFSQRNMKYEKRELPGMKQQMEHVMHSDLTKESSRTRREEINGHT